MITSFELCEFANQQFDSISKRTKSILPLVTLLSYLFGNKTNKHHNSGLAIYAARKT